VADVTSVEMMLLWVKVVERMVPTSHLAFPDLDGSELVHLERKITSASSTLGHSLPTATRFRKSLEIHNKRLNGPLNDAVSRALTHSVSTAHQYY